MWAARLSPWLRPCRIPLDAKHVPFTVEGQASGQENSYAINRVDVTEKARDETAVTLFRHPDDYVTQLLDQSGFVKLKVLEFLAFKYPAENREVFFKAYVARRTDSKSEHAIFLESSS